MWLSQKLQSIVTHVVVNTHFKSHESDVLISNYILKETKLAYFPACTERVKCLEL